MAPLVEPHPPSPPPPSRSAPQELRHATQGYGNRSAENGPAAWPRGAPRAPARDRGARPARSLRPSAHPKGCRPPRPPAHTQGAPEGVPEEVGAGRETRRPAAPPGRCARARWPAVRRRCSCRTGRAGEVGEVFLRSLLGDQASGELQGRGKLGKAPWRSRDSRSSTAPARCPRRFFTSNDSSAIVCPVPATTKSGS